MAAQRDARRLVVFRDVAFGEKRSVTDTKAGVAFAAPSPVLEYHSNEQHEIA